MVNLKDLTLKEKIGQMIGLAFSGSEYSKELQMQIEDIEAGLIIYFKDNCLNPKQIFDYYSPLLKNINKECLYAIYLNTKGYVISEQIITQGTVSSSLIDGRDIIKWALKLSASAIILVHNHPSGDSTPSIQDMKVTNEVVKQAKLMDLVVLDHIIIGDTYFSMKENSLVFKS